MKTIGKLQLNETIIERSRFICQIKRIESIEEGVEFLNSVKKEHSNANHSCSAMVYHNNARSSDDGEPSGTAGIPMLNVLKHHGLDEVVAVVTRYFGGVKLGAGGLIRAYSGAVADALLDADIVEVVEMTVVEILTDYSNANTVSSKVSIPVRNTEYLSDVRLTFYVDPDKVDGFLNEVQNLTSANYTHVIKGTIKHIK